MQDLSRLLSGQYRRGNGRVFFCKYCLWGCSSQEVYDKHIARCKLHGEQLIKLPKEDGEDNKVNINFSHKIS